MRPSKIDKPPPLLAALVLTAAAAPGRADRHLGDGGAKMVFFRDPERSVLSAREHRKREKAPFAARQNQMSIRPSPAPSAGRVTCFFLTSDL